MIVNSKVELINKYVKEIHKKEKLSRIFCPEISLRVNYIEIIIIRVMYENIFLLVFNDLYNTEK